MFGPCHVPWWTSPILELGKWRQRQLAQTWWLQQPLRSSIIEESCWDGKLVLKHGWDGKLLSWIETWGVGQNLLFSIDFSEMNINLYQLFWGSLARVEGPSLAHLDSYEMNGTRRRCGGDSFSAAPSRASKTCRTFRDNLHSGPGRWTQWDHLVQWRDPNPWFFGACLHRLFVTTSFIHLHRNKYDKNLIRIIFFIHFTIITITF